MDNPIWDKISDNVHNGLFGHTLAEYAVQKLEGHDKKAPINVCVVGDDDITNVSLVMRNLTTFLKYFERKEYYRIITGTVSGTETVVAKACKVNAVDHVIVEMDERTRRNRDEYLIENSDVLFILTYGDNPDLDFMYKTARESGLIVVRCILRKRK